MACAKNIFFFWQIFKKNGAHHGIIVSSFINIIHLVFLHSSIHIDPVPGNFSYFEQFSTLKHLNSLIKLWSQKQSKGVGLIVGVWCNIYHV